MTARLILLAVAVSGSGCGTVANLADHQQIYGGTSLDVTSALHAYKELSHPDDPHEFSTTHDESMLLASCSDVPLSALADTFTLPITCYYWLKERIKGPDASAGAAAVPKGSPSPPPSAELTARDGSHGADRSPGTSAGPVPVSSEKPADW
jgi:uncharacterized protein YceK